MWPAQTQPAWNSYSLLGVQMTRNRDGDETVSAVMIEVANNLSRGVDAGRGGH